MSPIITLEKTTSASFALTWTEIPGLSTEGYTVSFNNEEEKTFDQYFHAINLSAFTKYHIIISGESIDGDIYLETITVLTDPNPPNLRLIARVTKDLSENKQKLMKFSENVCIFPIHNNVNLGNSIGNSIR